MSYLKKATEKINEAINNLHATLEPAIYCLGQRFSNERTSVSYTIIFREMNMYIDGSPLGKKRRRRRRRRSRRRRRRRRSVLSG